MPVVMGTAGHIDHGKTTLVRALTGTDCDRLQEEKRRGITIELGFAFVPLPDGGKLSVVDVPGHERFIKNMVAGTAGIDFVMLVIAADEGVMPQTREHLEICSLLGIRKGLVALTKIDAVDAEWLELVKEDIRVFLEGSFLEDAPLCPVSSQTGQGIEALRDAIVTYTANLNPARLMDLPRLPVDRVFTLRGHGTVVTGTLMSGAFSLGQNLVLLPSGLTSRVRGLQSHGEAVEKARMGFRTAVNLPDLEVADIERGEVLTAPGRLFPSQSWLVRLTCLSSSPRALLHRTAMHFYHGAKSVQARIFFRDRDRLEPGDSALCLVRFAEPLVGVFGDPFVLRAYSPLRTVGGGAILHPLPLQWQRKDKDFSRKSTVLASLAELEKELGASQTREGYLGALILAQLELAGRRGASFAQLCVLACQDSSVLEKELQLLGARQKVFLVDKEERLYLLGDEIEALCATCLEWFVAFHAKEKLKTGVSRNAVLSSSWGKSLPPKLGYFILARLQGQNKLKVEGDVIGLATHEVTLDNSTQTLRDSILAAYTKAGTSPPNQKDVLDALKITLKQGAPVFKLLQDSGELVKITEGMYYAKPALDAIEKKLRDWYANHKELTLTDFKDITDLSRKYLISLLEYFDRIRVTLRTGDVRILRV